MAQIVNLLYDFLGVSVGSAVTFPGLLDGIVRLCIAVGILKYAMDSIFLFARSVRRDLR